MERIKTNLNNKFKKLKSEINNHKNKYVYIVINMSGGLNNILLNFNYHFITEEDIDKKINVFKIDNVDKCLEDIKNFLKSKL